MAQGKGKDFQTTALEKLVEARRTAIESIAKGHSLQLEKHLRLLTSAQAGIDVLKKEKAEISKSFKMTNVDVVFPKEPQPYRPFKEDNGN